VGADLGLVLAKQENEGRYRRAIGDLLRELAELRELDRQRHTHAPGTAAHDAANLEVDLRSRRLFDRFRDLKRRRAQSIERSPLTETRRASLPRRLNRNGGASAG
jgi:hypothetical protein